MKKLKRDKNWRDYDQLDGKDLIDGERVRIRFPSGIEEEHELVVKKSSYGTSDMGHSVSIPVSTAGIKIEYNGLECWVRIPEGTPMRRLKND